MLAWEFSFLNNNSTGVLFSNGVFVLFQHLNKKNQGFEEDVMTATSMSKEKFTFKLQTLTEFIKIEHLKSEVFQRLKIRSLWCTLSLLPVTTKAARVFTYQNIFLSLLPVTTKAARVFTYQKYFSSLLTHPYLFVKNLSTLLRMFSPIVF